jgi:peroxiredoxin
VTPHAFEKARLEILAECDQQDIDAYEALTQWLRDSGVAEHALKVGDIAPDFLLPDVDGRLVSSGALRKAGPLVVSFFLGDWCPFCTAELCALQTANQSFEAANARLLAITPDTRDLPREYKRRNGFQFTVLSDVDHGVSLSYGVIFSVPDSTKDYLRGRGVDLSDRHGTRSWMLPMPATFIVDQDGVVRHAFVVPDFTRREEPSALLEALRAGAVPARPGSPGPRS